MGKLQGCERLTALSTGSVGDWLSVRMSCCGLWSCNVVLLSCWELLSCEGRLFGCGVCELLR